MIVNHRLARQGRIYPFWFQPRWRASPCKRTRQSNLTRRLCVGLAILIPAGLFARDFSAVDRALRAEAARAGQPAALIVIEANSARRVYEFLSPELDGKNVFPPGSMAKPWSAAVLLKHRRALGFDPGRSYQCTGRFYPAPFFTVTTSDRRVLNFQTDPDGREYLPCSRSGGHGRLALTDALTHSCNAYFLSAVAGHASTFYRLYLNEWSLAESSAVITHDATPRLALARSLPATRITPMLATAAAIGEGGAVRVSPGRAAQMFLALNNGGRLLALQNDGAGAGPRLVRRLQFAGPDLQQIRFALGRVAVNGTLNGFDQDLAKDHRQRLTILAAKTGSATPYQRRYGSHGWLALDFRAASGREYVLIAFVLSGTGGQAARAFARHALLVLESYL